MFRFGDLAKCAAHMHSHGAAAFECLPWNGSGERVVNFERAEAKLEALQCAAIGRRELRAGNGEQLPRRHVA